jgi:hypothetical protein
MASHTYSPNHKSEIVAICILLSRKTTQLHFFLPFALCFFISLALFVFPFFSTVKLFFTYYSVSQAYFFSYLWDNLQSILWRSKLYGQSQWPCGLRHELSSLAWTLGLWVRIPLKVWMSVLWRARVLETPFGLLLRFITTSLVVTTITFYNVRSSLPCWFLILVDPLIAGFLVAVLIWHRWSSPDVASLIGSFDLLLTLRLWSAPLICPFFFFCSPPRNRVLAPRIEGTLSKGYFSSVGQVVVTGITSVNIRCSDNNCSPSRCLGIATIRSLFVVAGKR